MRNIVNSPKNQLEIIKNLHEKINIKEGDTVYLLNTTWINQWIKFVKHSTNKLSNEHYCGMINNEILLQQNEFDKNNRIHVNYEFVPREIWKLFVKWYGGGPEIKFNIIDTGKQLIPDIDQMIISIIYKNSKADIITNQNVLLSKIKSKVFNIFDISREKQIYLKNLNDNLKKKLIDDISLKENNIYNNNKLQVKIRHTHNDSFEESDSQLFNTQKNQYSNVNTQINFYEEEPMYSDTITQTKLKEYHDRQIQVKKPKIYLKISNYYTAVDIIQKNNFKIETQEIFETKPKEKNNLKLDKQEIFEINPENTIFINNNENQLSEKSNEIKVLKEQLAQLKKQINSLKIDENDQNKSQILDAETINDLEILDEAGYGSSGKVLKVAKKLYMH